MGTKIHLLAMEIRLKSFWMIFSGSPLNIGAIERKFGRMQKVKNMKILEFEYQYSNI